MIARLIAENAREATKRSNEWLEINYGIIKDDFGKMVHHNGIDYIIVGLKLKNHTEPNGEISGGYSYTVTHEIFIVLKSSFTNEIEISLANYLANKYENNL